MTITDYILSKTARLKVNPEYTPGKDEWKAFNDGGVEIEIAEFLYSLVKMIKPAYVLETGTHLGISALYMALAFQENKKGSLTTYEIISPLQNSARALWNDLGVTHLIESKLLSSLAETNVKAPIDILFLDSEPQLRFDEFVKYFPFVVPGGIIMIHDLHPSMGHHGQVYHGVYDWPYGDFTNKLGSYFNEQMVSIVHFRTPRGFTLFQKEALDFNSLRYKRGQPLV